MIIDALKETMIATTLLLAVTSACAPVNQAAQENEIMAMKADHFPQFVGKKEKLSAEMRTRIAGRTINDGASWWPECPTKLDEMSYLTVSYVGFDHKPHLGHMIVREKISSSLISYMNSINKIVDRVDPAKKYLIPIPYLEKDFHEIDVASGIIEVFRRLYEARFPLQEMQLVDQYKNDDAVSMKHNNTYSLSCYPRNIKLDPKELKKSWYQHSFGLAIDINPIQNPYVTKKEDGTVSVDPVEGTNFYESRAQYVEDPAKANAAGVIVPGGVVYRAFAEVFGPQYAWTWGGQWKSSLDHMHFSWNDM